MASGNVRHPEGNTAILELLECPICLEPFKQPKCLPCLHSFCELCLSTFIESTRISQAGSISSFDCPVCRAKVVPPDAESTPEQWSKSLPTNHLITTLIDSTKFDSISEMECNICKDFGNSLQATYWCKQCREAFCENCKTYHNRIKASSSHTVHLIQELRQKPLEVVAIDDNCPHHKGRQLEVFCVNHRNICCILCVTTQHRQCSNIQTLEKMAETMEESNDMNTLKKWLDQLQKHSLSIIKERSTNIQHLDDKRKECEDILDASVKQAKDKLDQFRDRCKEKMNTTHKIHSTAIQENSLHVQRFVKTVENAQKLLKAVSEYGTPLQLFITLERLKVEVKTHLEQLKKDAKDENKVTIDNIVQEIFQTIEKALVQVPDPTIELSQAMARVADMDISDTTRTTQYFDYWDTNPVMVKTLMMQENSYSPGGVYLPNGELLVVDRPSNVILRINEALDITKRYGLLFDDYPACICLADQENQLFVSFYDSQLIRKVELKEKVQQIDKIVTKEYVWSVEKVGKHLLVSEPSSVNFINPTGTYVKSFKKSKESRIKYATASKLSGNIYSSEGEELVCRMDDGQEVFRYSHPLLNDPRGIALDSDDNVYVCGSASKNIHQISADGSRSRILISDIGSMISLPMGIAFHPNGRTFCVTSFGSGDSIVFYTLQ